jgi:signal transduction histidine kinase
MATVDLNKVVTEVSDLYRAHGAIRGVRFTVELDPALDTVVVDPGRLRQLLNNLLTNAVEALEGQGEGSISVATRRTARGGAEVAEICVEDDGPGFQREMIGQVFDPYVTTKVKGTGLGLAIVRKIVEEHGGHIEAENRASGGARVRIDLPLQEAGADSARGRATSEPRRERA